MALDLFVWDSVNVIAAAAAADDDDDDDFSRKSSMKVAYVYKYFCFYRWFPFFFFFFNEPFTIIMLPYFTASVLAELQATFFVNSYALGA